jgi:hypothetical protein
MLGMESGLYAFFLLLLLLAQVPKLELLRRRASRTAPRLC